MNQAKTFDTNTSKLYAFLFDCIREQGTNEPDSISIPFETLQTIMGLAESETALDSICASLSAILNNPTVLSLQDAGTQRTLQAESILEGYEVHICLEYPDDIQFAIFPLYGILRQLLSNPNLIIPSLGF